MESLTLFLLIALAIISFYLLVVEQRYRGVKNSHSQLQALINGIPYLIWVKDKQSRFLLVNKHFCKTFSVTKEEIIGKTDVELSVEIQQAQGYYRDDLNIQKRQKPFQIEKQLTDNNGTSQWTSTTNIPILNKKNKILGTAGIVRNIDKHKHNEQKIAHLAYYDHLTDLPNRLSFVNELNNLLIRCSGAVAIILFDLNNFKIVNDSLGHKSGDQILIQIANRLKKFINDDTTIARLSGDEFVIAHNYSRSKNSLQKLQTNLLELFQQPITLSDIKHNVSASFGIAVAPHDGNNYETLLQHADLAMYQSKHNKHEHCVYFKQEFADTLLYKMELSNKLDQGINKQQFSLVYQPKIDSSTGNLIGAEALLRWQLDDQQWISPADFIPIAEKNGFIIELGEWVIENVLKQIKSWLDNKIRVSPISINVSAVQLRQPCFVENLLQKINDYQIPGNLIELELTETVIIEDIARITTVLKQIQKKQIAISIDDFGTGYSSLSYLPQLPINTLKVDRSFLSNIHDNLDNQKIVQTIVSLADNFNLSIIAEGVETEAELAETRSCGIKNIQGYYYSRPLSTSDLEEKWLCNLAKAS